MFTLEAIQLRLEQALPGARVQLVMNPSPSAQHSLLIDREHARAAALLLRDDPEWQFDYLSNLTAVDWLDKTIKETKRTREVVDGLERDIDRVIERMEPGYFEVVCHLYSVALRHGPLILRMRTPDRTDTHLPSLTPVWRGAEFQEREAYDLFGIVFDGHPDLRRILMWEGFQDHPMRKDYVAPDDFEYEPTPHDEVLERAKAHLPKPQEASQ